jgi:hypothetical protein
MQHARTSGMRLDSSSFSSFFSFDRNLAGGLIHLRNSLRQINKTARHFAVKYPHLDAINHLAPTYSVLLMNTHHHGNAVTMRDPARIPVFCCIRTRQSIPGRPSAIWIF